MSADINEIKETVKAFVNKRFLKNAEGKELNYSENHRLP